MSHPTTIMRKSYPFYLANKPEQPNTDLAVTDKFSGETATRVAVADAAEPLRKMPPFECQAVLNHCVKRFKERFDELADVLINEIPSWRVDNLPYGGVKDSGLGREGIRFAIEDMTEIRSLFSEIHIHNKPMIAAHNCDNFSGADGRRGASILDRQIL